MPITVNYNGQPWLNAESTPNYVPNYDVEKWKWASLYVLKQDDPQYVLFQGLEREIPQDVYYRGLEVKYDDTIM